MKHLLKRELIGLTINVVDSKNKANINLKGRIVDETKHTLIIQTKEKQKKRMFKKNIAFTTKIKNQNYKIMGTFLEGKPEERIKKTSQH